MSFTTAVEAFEKASPWLGDVDAPAVETLRTIAEVLDEGDRTPALMAQFGLTHRALLKRAPAADEPADPLEAALGKVDG